MSINIIDIVIILLLLGFAMIGFKRGAIPAVISLVGTILILLVSYKFKGTIGNYLMKYLPFFNFTGTFKGLVTLNILVYQLIGFILIAFVLFALFGLILKLTGLIEKAADALIILAIPSKIIGFIAGFLEGYLIIFIICLALLIPLKDNDLFQNSMVVNKMVYHTPIVTEKTAHLSSAIKDLYTLNSQIEAKKISTNKANLQIMTIMLKYKVIDKKTVEQLIVLDKLKSVKGISKLVNNYKEEK